MGAHGEIKPLPNLVGIAGKKRSGKDTAGRALGKHGFTRLGFADALKNLVLYLNPEIDGDNIAYLVSVHGWEGAKDKFPGVRDALETIGLALRKVDPDYWVEVAMEHRLELGRTVITDVRFPNEVRAIERAGGVVVRIERPGLPTDNRPSEIALDGFDLPTIINDGTPEDLASALLATLEELA